MAEIFTVPIFSLPRWHGKKYGKGLRQWSVLSETSQRYGARLRFQNPYKSTAANNIERCIAELVAPRALLFAEVLMKSIGENHSI